MKTSSDQNSAVEPKSLTLRLTRTASDKRFKREPLGDLLAGAVEAMKGVGYTFKARWLAEQGIRALCEQIILTKQISLPVEVNFTGIKSDAPAFTLDEDRQAA